MELTINNNKITVTTEEFIPEVFAKEELCEHDLTTKIVKGKIESSVCSKCDHAVFS
jgi:hypothetical protein